jgi:mannosyltransferase
VPDPSRIDVIAPNFKRRLSGVTSTIIQLLPLQAGSIGIASLGGGLPAETPRLSLWQVPALFGRPASGRMRVWHARRNTEMLAGVVLRSLGAPLRLVFTSASQRRHTAWTRFLIRRMDAVIATSERTAAYLEVPSTVIMHGIDTHRFAPAVDAAAAKAALGLDAGQRYIGCFGRVRRQKGTDLFVDAMIALLHERPGWSAIIAGETTAQHAAFDDGLRRRVADAGLAERVHFVGVRRDIPDWYRVLSLFVAPQRWEGFGLTPLEAMATGVPVVATEAGAFPELVEDGVTGAVVPRDDGPAMTQAIARYLDDEAARAAAAEAALSLARTRFPLEREAAAIIAVYEQQWAKG